MFLWIKIALFQFPLKKNINSFMKILSRDQNNIILNPSLDLLIRSQVTSNKIEKVESFVDTGFDGALSINSKFAKLLGLPLVGTGIVINADNIPVPTPIYEIKIEFPSLEAAKTKFLVRAITKDNQKQMFLIGMQLLKTFADANNSNLVFNFQENRIEFVEFMTM